MAHDGRDVQRRGPALEQLEQRLLLDGVAESQAIELFNVSPTLFVENQGQRADERLLPGHGAGAYHTRGQGSRARRP